jgi:hypothetical protein
MMAAPSVIGVLHASGKNGGLRGVDSFLNMGQR